MRGLPAAIPLLFFLPGAAGAALTGEVCGKDLNGDGMFDAAGEISQCVEQVCPYDTAACDPSFAAPSCPSPGEIDTIRDMCRAAPLSIDCPAGYGYDASLDRCVGEVSCSEGGVFNPATDLCEKLVINDCPPGYAYDGTRDLCFKSAACADGGTFAVGRDRCEKAAVPTCPSGYAYNSSRSQCEAAPICSRGSYNTTYDKCLAPYSPGCPSGYAYVPGRARCERAPVCSSGTYSASLNKCVSGGTASYPATATFGSCTGWGMTGPYLLRYCGQPNGSASFADITTYACMNIDSGYDWGPNCELSDGNGNSIPPGSSGTVCALGKCYDINNTSSATYACPHGGSLSGATCTVDTTSYTNPSCPSGTMDYSRDVCYASYSVNCPSGMTYSSSLGQCYRSASCSSSGTLDKAVDRCVLQEGQDCGTYSYDPAAGICFSPPVCANGAYSSAANQCQAAVAKNCGTYSWDGAARKCELAPPCPAPGGFAAAIDGCAADPDHVCPSGYAWNSLPVSACEAVIVCSSGVYDPTADQCYLGDYSCPLGDFACADIDGNGANECSAFPCVDLAATPPAETPTDTSTYRDDGEVDPATGECSGVFKVFNGEGGECLPPGWSTTFFDCCDADQGSFLFLREVCPEASVETVQAVQAGRVHLVGEYCKKKIPLIGCIQKARMYCTFNSKMGRIVQEQGRPQLLKFAPDGGWGVPEAPRCEGFSPEEFQMLDFSEIDLSELFGDLDPAGATAVQIDAQDKIDAYYQQLR